VATLALCTQKGSHSCKRAAQSASTVSSAIAAWKDTLTAGRTWTVPANVGFRSAATCKVTNRGTGTASRLGLLVSTDDGFSLGCSGLVSERWPFVRPVTVLALAVEVAGWLFALPVLGLMKAVEVVVLARFSVGYSRMVRFQLAWLMTNEESTAPAAETVEVETSVAGWLFKLRGVTLSVVEFAVLAGFSVGCSRTVRLPFVWSTPNEGLTALVAAAVEVETSFAGWLFKLSVAAFISVVEFAVLAGFSLECSRTVRLPFVWPMANEELTVAVAKEVETSIAG
jgi:hypothetical protein